MKRIIISALALAFCLPPAFAQQGQLDGSPTLFTVMAALNAAGLDTDLDSPSNSPLRKLVRAELAKRTIPSLPAIKDFFQKHRAATSSAELSQYVSLALTVGPPPDFTIAVRDVDIPPDVAPLTGMVPLLAAFYKEAGIEDLWRQAQPFIDQMIAPYHGPVTEKVQECNAYLRQQSTGFRGRHFQILLDPLAPPNQVHSRSYGNEYTIVLTPSAEPHIQEVRQAYLYYLLDPLATRNEETLNRKKILADHAQRARLLGDSYKQDFLLLTTGSLVRAVQARLDRKPLAAQKAFVEQALKEGYILTPYFFEALIEYEKQEQSMMLYYSSMVQSIDLVREEKRLAAVEFASPEPVETTTAPAPKAPSVLDTIKAAEEALKADDVEKAEKLFQDVLQQTDKKPLLAVGNYGLARIALAQASPDVAETLFERVLDLEPDAPVKTWSMVYLGRLRMEVGDKEHAARYFQEALKIAGGPDPARQQAQQALQQISK